MTMPPRLRKLALTAHVVCSVGSLGAVAGFLTLAIVGLTSVDEHRVRGAYLAMDLIAWFVILPLIFAALLTGLVQALGTPWGLFRHYWILAKFSLTVVVAFVLLLQLKGISHMGAVAAKAALSGTDLGHLRISLVVHAGGGLLVLLVPAALSVFKPRGVTRYGRRKQHEEGAQPSMRPPN